MCVEIKGQGILAELAQKETIPKTPIIGPIYAFVIDRCGNCKQGKMKKAFLLIRLSAQIPIRARTFFVNFENFQNQFSPESDVCPNQQINFGQYRAQQYQQV